MAEMAASVAVFQFRLDTVELMANVELMVTMQL